MIESGYFQDEGNVIKMNYQKSTIGTDLGYRHELHSHQQFEIYYFHAGKCNYFIDDKIYALSPGDMLIMHGMTLHKPYPDPNVEYTRSILHFDPNFISDLTKTLNQVDLFCPFRKFKNIRLHLSQKDREINHLLSNIYHSYLRMDQPLHHVRLRIYLLELLALIYETSRNLTLMSSSHHEAKVKNVQNIIDFIECNYKRADLTLDDIAREMYLSKFYISRLFKEVTGTNIKNYILSKKINLAKVLMLSSDLNISDVAYEVGFKHSAHFSRIFKQKVGMTAEAFRKTYDYRRPDLGTI